MLLRKSLALLVALMTAAQPVLAQERYFFRYKPGPVALAAPAPGTPADPAEYDITARFAAVSGIPFEAEIPLKSGTHAGQWVREGGSLPQGLVLDGATGTISGVPERPQSTHMAVRGYSPDGTQGSSASVAFDVFEPRDNAAILDVYAHAGRAFADRIPTGRATVHEWTALTPMPQWVSAASSQLTGTPPEGTEGVFGIALSGTDYLGQEVAFAYGTVTVAQGPAVAFIDDAVQHPSQMFDVRGRAARSMGDLRWSVEGDPLPANLRLNAREGRIYGTVPTFSTDAEIRLSAMDTDGAVGRSNWFRIATTEPDDALSSARDRSLVVGEFASFGFSSAEAPPPAQWEIREGSLPQGLVLDEETGRVSGTPVMAELQEGIVISAQSQGGYEQSNPFSIEVHPAPVGVAFAAVAVRAGEQVSTAAPQVTGASHPWSFAPADGATLSPGLSLDAETGAVSGSVAAAGNHSVALVLTDADGRQSRPATQGIMAYAPLAVSVGSDAYSFPRMTRIDPIVAEVAEDSLMPGAEGGFGTFGLVGTLPQGLDFNELSGAISGIPSAEGESGPLAVTVTDGSGQTASSQQFTITVGPRQELEAMPADTPLELKAHLHSAVTAAFAENAIGEVSWSLERGTLPEGVQLGPDGVLRGTADTTGEYPGTVLRATDSEGASAVTPAFTVSVVPPDAIAMETLFEWPAGQPFSTQLSASSAAGEATFSVDASTPLPPGVSLSPSGLLAGTVDAPLSASATIGIQDQAGRTGNGTLDIVIHPPMAMELDALHELRRQEAAEIVPALANAIGAVAFSRQGDLPPGMSFDPGTGAVFGRPAAEGMWDGITVTATDGAGSVRSATFGIAVGPRRAISLAYDFSQPLSVNSTQGLPKLPLEPTNAVGATAYAVTGALPAGMGFNAATGAFTGRPLQAGTFGGIEVSATDSEGATATAGPFQIIVTPGGGMSQGDLTRTVRAGGYVDSGAISPAGAVAPLDFVARSPLPAGLTLISSTGSIVGVLAETGTSAIEMTVSDAAGRSDDFRLVLEAVGDIALAYPDAVLNQHGPASLAPSVSNAVGSTAYSLTAGQLPQGLALDPATGAISGVPEAVETRGGIEVAVADEGTAGNAAVSAPFSITVGERLPLQVTAAAENTVIANAPYSMTPSLANAVGAVSWSMAGDLPPGLGFDPATGTVAGQTGEIGTWSGITLTATDSAGGSHTTGPISFAATTNGLPIRMTAAGLKTKPGFHFETPAPRIFNAAGTVAFQSGDLAAYGLSLDPLTGSVSGSVSQVATITYNLEVTDSSNRLTSEPVTVEVIPNLRITVREGVDLAINAGMAAVRPVTDYAIGAVGYELLGTLPQGLAFSPSTGAITGTPIELGTFEDLRIRGTDSVGDSHLSEAFRITVHPSGAVPSVSFPVPPVWTAGTTSVNLAASWSPRNVGDLLEISGALPEGLSFDPESGQLSGVPAEGTHGLYEGYVVSVTDAAGLTGFTEAFDLRIQHPDRSAAAQTLSVRANQPFESQPPQYNSDAAVGEMVYGKHSGFVAGIELDPATGIVSGKTAASRNLSVSRTDVVSDHTPMGIAVQVVNPTVSVPSSQTMEAGTEIVSAEPAVANMFSPVFSLSAGNLPEGLSLDPASGRIYGVMPQATVSGLRITATDEYGSAESGQFSLAGQITVPDPFGWPDVLDAEPDTWVWGPDVEISGPTVAVEVSMETSHGSNTLRHCLGSSCTTRSGIQIPFNLAPGRTLAPRVRSGAFGETVTATVTVGGVQSTWSVTTRDLDVNPDAFTIPAVDGVLRNTMTESEAVQVSGFPDDTEITVSGPPGTQFRRGSGSSVTGNWTDAGTALSFRPGWRLQVRMPSADTDGTAQTAHVTVGDRTVPWTVTTMPRTLLPDPIEFVDLDGLTPNGSIQSSDFAPVSGISEPVTVTLSTTGDSNSLTWRRCNASGNSCNSHASGSGLLSPGDIVRLNARGPSEYGETVTVTAQIGERTVTWSLSTRELDLYPDEFGWTDLTGQPAGKQVESEQVTFSGIPDDVPWSWSAPAGSTASACRGMTCSATRPALRTGDRLRLTIRTSDLPDTDAVFSVTVGNVTRTWTVRTAPADGLPDDFAFEDLDELAPGVLMVSNRVMVSGVIHDAPVSISPNAEWRDCRDASGTIGCSSFGTGTRAVEPGRFIEIRMAAPDNGLTRTASLTIGGLTRDWNLATREYVQTPDDFSLPPAADVAPGATTTVTVDITGIPDPVPVSVTGPGSPRLCPSSGPSCAFGGSWTDSTTMTSGSLQVRLNAHPENEGIQTVAVTVGDMTRYWQVTTRDLHLTPDDFGFTDVTVEPGAFVNSGRASIRGIPDPVPVSISGPPGAVYCTTSCGFGGGWLTEPSMIAEGNRNLGLRMQSSSVPGETVTMSVTVGDTTRTWSVTAAQ